MGYDRLSQVRNPDFVKHVLDFERANTTQSRKTNTSSTLVEHVHHKANIGSQLPRSTKQKSKGNKSELSVQQSFLFSGSVLDDFRFSLGSKVHLYKSIVVYIELSLVTVGSSFSQSIYPNFLCGHRNRLRRDGRSGGACGGY